MGSASTAAATDAPNALAATLGVADIRWETSSLVETPDAVGVDAVLDLAQSKAANFERHRGTLASVAPEQFASIMRELGEIVALLERAGARVYLEYSVDVASPENGAAMAKITERTTAIGNQLVFFDLEWAALEDNVVNVLLDATEVAFCRHALRVKRLGRPYLLSEPEEKIVSEKAVTGVAAWTRLFDEQLAALTVNLDDERKAVSFEVAMSELQHPDQTRRRTAADAIGEALQPGLRTRAYIYNVLLADKSTDDRLRGFPMWASSRNLSNQTSDESVAALVEAVVSRYDIVRDWYRLKARLLGLDRLHFSDRNSVLPIGGSEEQIRWNDAKGIVLDAFGSFSPRIANTAKQFFDERRIDAPADSTKRSGAFCMPTVPGAQPFVLVNYTGTRNDVLTLAHELGHGVHFSLSQAKQSVFEIGVPLTVAETASVFGETVTFDRILNAENDPAARLNLLASSMDAAIATVFRQVAMFRFEDMCHRARRSEGELSVDAINGHWMTAQQELFGDTVDARGYESWWSYVTHFVHVPGYVYAYAFGQLLAISVYQRFLEVGPSFVPRYEAMLEAGGSRSPEDLGAMVDCDLRDPQFWADGLKLIESTLADAQAAAAALPS